MTEVKDSHQMELERVTKKAQDLESQVKRLRKQISSLCEFLKGVKEPQCVGNT